MPVYDNLYLLPGSIAWDATVSLDADCHVSGEPDITFTWVKDPAPALRRATHLDFPNAIRIGRQCYIESRDCLGVHNGRVKLTVVKVNDQPAGHIVIGDHAVLQGTAIVAYQSVTLEDHVTLGPNVTIMDSSGHPLSGRGQPDEAARITTAPVHIKAHAWIGMNAIILKGVTIGKHAVVGAGSVVRQSVPDYGVVLGNPATLVKRCH
ncbi:DapH/DapD/GlmU-related protein [Serratia quinivorans]|uniref:DapH/DapD/GlmU-related protein n=1 Tax=Serratia quinivorans TaxID=137545 RepID=UPI00217C06A5|nr:DapH/DapD/GlmU-related protein [Serratia quinivorans]CAI1112935.1 Putative acetyltransferase SACOL2570 [Serratia quinivorans]CAI1874612.1 Putative acetyltransferase SACOL2570 [Serratia quinivorans]